MAEEAIENTGKELINATQEAVIGAVTDVSNIIKTTSEEISEMHHEVFYQSAEFWVGAAFVLVMVLMFVPIRKIVRMLLQKQIDNVVNQISNAESLRNEARQLLADYEQKTENLDKETKKMMSTARKNVEIFQKKELEEFKKELLSQEKYAENIMKARRDQIIDEASQEIIERTSEILMQTIRDNLSEEAQKLLIDKSIAAIAELKP